MKIGILQTGHTPEALVPTSGNYGDMFARFLSDGGFDFEVYSVVDMAFPSGPEACDGWLITGSKHGAYENHPFIAPLEDLIRAIYAADRPMVGVCFGHQIIAQALGGTVEKFKDGWAVGRQTYDWQGETVNLNAWHQDQVTTRPADAEPLAGNDFCENAALIYGKKAFTVQPHPEFESDFIEGLATLRGPGVVPDALLEEARANLEKDNHNKNLAAMVTKFFKERVVL